MSLRGTIDDLRWTGTGEHVRVSLREASDGQTEPGEPTRVQRPVLLGEPARVGGPPKARAMRVNKAEGVPRWPVPVPIIPNLLLEKCTTFKL